MNKYKNTSVYFLIMFLAASCVLGEPQISFKNNTDKNQWSVQIDGKEVMVYNFGEDVDLPNYCPLRSPSGKNLLIQKTTPYPHHRAFWFADTIQTAQTGRKVSLYNAYYTGKKDPQDKDIITAPYADHIRHIRINSKNVGDNQAIVEKQLIWEYDHTKPLLDEHRKIRIVALGDSEYFLDMTFNLAASYLDVDFVSDWVHYGWPYLRMNPIFSGEKGGTITSSTGAAGQAETNGKVALWIDYSNTVEGVTEGLAVFQWPDGKDHKWLTREYGTFGPRRPDDQSGKKFTLKKDTTITQRVGILVHKGDVKTAKVAERYKAYISGKL